ncbi:MAG TPA: GNAT family protein [Intrasporangium sp.]|nr:GNAT family protein [Intrasporangium sp.]
MRMPWRSRHEPSAPWPIELREESADPAIVLRPLTLADEYEWQRVRRANVEHVRPWEPTLPPGVPSPPAVSFAAFVRELDTEGRAGRAMPWCVVVEGRIVGQVHLFAIVRGAQLSGAAGYWLDQSLTGRGIMTRALAAALDHALGAGGLHRMEVNIRLDNAPSLAVVRRLGLRDEGIRQRFLHIDGAWRDHRSFAVTREEVGPGGLVGRLTPP